MLEKYDRDELIHKNRLSLKQSLIHHNFIYREVAIRWSEIFRAKHWHCKTLNIAVSVVDNFFSTSGDWFTG